MNARVFLSILKNVITDSIGRASVLTRKRETNDTGNAAENAGMPHCGDERNGIGKVARGLEVKKTGKCAQWA